MKRRTFLLIAIFLFITKGFAQRKNNQYEILKAVLNHLFPNTNKYSGANNFKAFDFLMFISKHPSFEKSDLDFIIEGTKKLQNFNNKFLELKKEEKETVLREFEKLNFGQNWLSTIMYYGIEAMLGDPIYGGNKNMLGWKNINHNIPIPTASRAFGKM